MHKSRPGIGMALGLTLALTGLTGCGSKPLQGEQEIPPTTEPAHQTATNFGSPAGEHPPAFEPPPAAGGQTALEEALEYDELAELDPTLAGIEEALADLNQFLNETAFVMEAEEGEFTP